MYIVRLDSKEADTGDGADNGGIKRNTNKKQSAKQKPNKKQGELCFKTSSTCSMSCVHVHTCIT